MLAGGPGPGIRGDLQARPEGRVLARLLPRLHARRLRRPRHRQVGAARLPVRADGRRRAGARSRAAPSTRRREHARGHRVGTPRARGRQDRDLGRLVRDEARRRVRARTSGPRRAPAARLRGVARQATRSIRCRCATIPALGNGICANNAVRGHRAGRRRPARRSWRTSSQAHPVTGVDRTSRPTLAPYPVAIDGQTLLSRSPTRATSAPAISSQLPAAIDAALAGWIRCRSSGWFSTGGRTTRPRRATSTSSLLPGDRTAATARSRGSRTTPRTRAKPR